MNWGLFLRYLALLLFKNWKSYKLRKIWILSTQVVQSASIWTPFNFLFCDFEWFLWPISTSTIQSLLYLIFWFCFTVRKSWLKQSATNWKAAAALWLVPDSKLGILQQFIRKNLKSTLLLVFFLCVYMLLICMPAYRLYGKKWK